MTDPIRDAAIEAAAKVARHDEVGDYGKAWTDLLEDTRDHYRAALKSLVDAVLAVAGPAYRAEALRDAADADARGYYMNDEWERFLRDRADAEEGK